ncbi:MAG: winged helix-turn-helix domain-containing protein [Gammaproteobacteria bacterium]
MSTEKLHVDPKRLFEFGPFTLEVDERRLLREGKLVPLTAKVFDLLLLLVESPGNLRSRNDLIDALWPNTIVEEHSLTSRISTLRKALGDEEDPPRYIETVRGQGYRFVADVKAQQIEASVPQQASRTNKPHKRLVLAGALTACALLATAGAILLWHIAAGTGTNHTSDKSIAVLPFENLSTDKSNGYFAEGIQDMILTKLADIGGLKVISRTSANLYKSHPKDLRTIARELGVANILEGSVQKSGDEVLINVQLINARKDQHIWAKAYTRTLSNVINVESDVSQRIADQLQVKLLPSVRQRIQTVSTSNPQAYDLLLRADGSLNQFFLSGSPSVLDNAINDYREAIQNDPKFALAYAQLSYALSITYNYLGHHTQKRLLEAEDAATKALTFNPNLAQAHSAKGYVLYWGERDYTAAMQQFQKALELKPQDAFLHMTIGSVYRRQGNWRAAVQEMEKAVSLNPRGIFALRNLALTYMALRRYKKALEVDNQIFAIEPNSPIDLTNIAYQYSFMGQINKALDTLHAVPNRYKKNIYVLYALSQTQILAHHFATACASASQMHANGQFPSWLVLSLQAEAQRLCGQEAEAHSKNLALVKELKTALVKTPNNSLMHAKIAMVYANIGDTGLAINEGQRAVNLSPSNKDVFLTPDNMGNLAQIYARLNKPAQAVALLKKLLQTPAGTVVSKPLLKVDPTWDPIRESPEFQKLLKSRFKINLNPF